MLRLGGAGMTKANMQAAFDSEIAVFRELINRGIDRKKWDDANSWIDHLSGVYMFGAKLGLCSEDAAYTETIYYRLLVHDAEFKELFK